MDFIRSVLPPSAQAFDLDAPAFLETPGLIAPFVYDAMIASGLAACDVYLRSANDTSPPYLDGTQHFRSILQQSFVGTTGMLHLDPVTGTRTAQSAFFQLVNHIEDETLSNATDVQYKAVLADIFDQGAWVELEPYVFNDGTTNIAPEVPPAETQFDYYSKATRTVAWIMCILVVGLSIAMMFWTRIHETHRVVRASQPIFLYVICLGCLLFASAILPLTIDPSVGQVTTRGCDVACQTVPWLLSIGFSLIFSALSAKTYRINMIMNQAVHFKRIQLQAWDVGKKMLIMVGLNIAVLTLQTALAPLYWDYEVEVYDSFGQALEGYGFCSTSDAWPYLLTLLLLNFAALCFAVYLAYHARNMSIEFAESDYIFRAITAILMLCFIGIPVLILASDNRDAYVFVFSAMIFLSSCCILLFIFVPKIMYLRAFQALSASQKAKSSRSSSFPSFGSRWGTTNVKISGLMSSMSTSTERNTHAQSGAAAAPARPGATQFSSQDTDDHLDDDDDGQRGLRIFTYQSREEMAKEIRQLKDKLKIALEGGRSTLRLSIGSAKDRKRPTSQNSSGAINADVIWESSDSSQEDEDDSDHPAPGDEKAKLIHQYSQEHLQSTTELATSESSMGLSGLEHPGPAPAEGDSECLPEDETLQHQEPLIDV